MAHDDLEFLTWPPTLFVGRSRELKSLCSLLLKGQTDIVSIEGPPGIGKTALAREFLVGNQRRFAGGTAWHDLQHTQLLSIADTRRFANETMASLARSQRSLV